jgi:hypothetical protein
MGDAGCTRAYVSWPFGVFAAAPRHCAGARPAPQPVSVTILQWRGNEDGPFATGQEHAMVATDAPVDFSILAGAGASLRSFKAGEIIFREGDPAEELYVVKSGKVEIKPWETP